jgi:hypothetical protein
MFDYIQQLFDRFDFYFINSKPLNLFFRHLHNHKKVFEQDYLHYMRPIDRYKF